MFLRLGRFTFRYRWPIIGLWTLVLALGLAFAPRVGSVLHSTVGQAPTEAQAGADILQRELGLPPSSFVVIYSAAEATVDDPIFRQGVEKSLAGLKNFQPVTRIESYYGGGNQHLVSEDRHSLYATIWLNLSLDEAIDRFPDIERRIGEPQGMSVKMTGAPVIFHQLEEASQHDLRRAEIITLPLLLVGLILIFGGLIAAGLPVLMGGISLVLTLAILFALGQVLEISTFAQNIASLIGLGVAVDYSLFMVSRFREEIRHRTAEEAIGVTIATAGQAVFFSGITTTIGLAGLLLFSFAFLRSLGVGGVVVILLSLLVALTLVPAILSVLGARIDAFPILRRKEGKKSLFWHSLAGAVMARPLLFLLPTGAALVLLGLPFLQVNLGPIWTGILPPEAPARTAWNFAGSTFGPGELTPMAIAVQSKDGIFSERSVGELYDYTRGIAALPGVERVESIVNISPGLTRDMYQAVYANREVMSAPQTRQVLAAYVSGDTTVIRVVTSHNIVTKEAKGLVRDIRAVPIPDGLTRYVTGGTATLQDSIGALYRDFPIAIGLVVAGIYVALLIQFRSLVLPLKAIIMNAASIFASYGALVFVFQQGHFQTLLHFASDGSVEATVPIILFCILFGLSMDYELFLLSRIEEEYDKTGDNTSSVALGMERSGRIITSAAMVVVVVGLAFSSGDVIIVKALGLGLALAVLIDATVVRALMAPALMRLLGRWNWWAPGWLGKRRPREIMREPPPLS